MTCSRSVRIAPRAPRTTSATGDPLSRTPAGTARAFTLVEVLITIFLIGLATALAVVNLGSILADFGEPDLPEALDRAVREARYETAARKVPVFLTFNAGTAAFELRDRDGTALASIATVHTQADQPAVTFLVEPPGFGRPDQRLGRPELVELRAVRFDPDRSAPAFVARWQAAGASGSVRYDAFSPAILADPEGRP